LFGYRDTAHTADQEKSADYRRAAPLPASGKRGSPQTQDNKKQAVCQQEANPHHQVGRETLQGNPNTEVRCSPDNYEGGA